MTTTSDRKRGRKWVIPKGEIAAPLKPHLSAIKEAYEEAGVSVGKPHPICVGKYRDSSKGEPIPTFLWRVLETGNRDFLWEYR